MNIFPCKNCIVKPCCSEYCNKLETSPNVIDIYVKSMRTCPDCGDSVNLGSNINKVTVLCFNCSKAFTLETFVKKKKLNLINLSSTTSPSSFGSSTTVSLSSLTIDTYKSIISLDMAKLAKPSPAANVTMEASHDVLYTRMPKKHADYAIKHYNLVSKSELNKKLSSEEWKKLLKGLIV